MSDYELLREYATTQSETAFAELVRRHAGMVHASAVRQTGNQSMAQEVTQAVFILLAKKAKSFDTKVMLAGWLFRAARYAANDLQKSERRRQYRETAAYQMNQTEQSVAPVWTDPSVEASGTWQQVSPVIDQCLSQLPEMDRHALLLRYFENHSLAEVGSTLGVTEEAARKRVTRALDRLQGLLTRCGAAVSTAALAPALMSQAAPALSSQLHATTMAAVFGSGAGAASHSTTASALATVLGKKLVWLQWKTWISWGVGAAVVAATGAYSWRQYQPRVTHQRMADEYRDDYRRAGFPKPEPVQEFIKNLQKAAWAKDSAQLSRMVQFPLRINSARGQRVVQNEAELEANFSGVFTTDVLNMILKCPNERLFCNDRGVMVGNGEVWIAPAVGQETGLVPKIIALNID